MPGRFEELAMRRRRLLLRSERLRADLSADQRVVMDAIGGFDRAVSKARRFASPVMMGVAALAAVRLLRRGRRASAVAARPGRGGLAMRGLMWLSLARRLLPYVGLVRAALRARRPDRHRGPL